MVIDRESFLNKSLDRRQLLRYAGNAMVGLGIVDVVSSGIKSGVDANSRVPYPGINLTAINQAQSMVDSLKSKAANFPPSAAAAQETLNENALNEAKRSQVRESEFNIPRVWAGIGVFILGNVIERFAQ